MDDIKYPALGHIHTLAVMKATTNTDRYQGALVMYGIVGKFESVKLNELVDWWNETGTDKVTYGNFKAAWREIIA